MNFVPKPDRVSKLILVGTTAKMAFSMRIQLWLMLNLLPYESFAKGSVDFKYHKPSEQIKKEAFERAIRTPKYAAYECFTEFTKNYNIREKVSQIQVPTLIIVGEWAIKR